MSATILVVDDEQRLATLLARRLEREGFEAVCAATAREARERMVEFDPDVVLMDLRLPDADGSHLIEELKTAYPHSEFVLITAHASIRSVVETMRRGAIDYLAKPFEPEEVVLAVHKILRERNLRAEVRRLRSDRGGLGHEPGTERSPSMKQVMALARRVAAQDGNVVFLGESGTGKDRLARWIHEHSRRREGPFFAVNCGALAPDLADSELFGHEPGAFTGTRGRKRGILELAERGTLLLNEVGELPLGLQTRLLTFLDTKTFLRVGGERTVKVDTRVFAATNRDLVAEVRHGRFRKDLFYRLNVVAVHMPPLRERLDDLEGLVFELLEELRLEMALPRPPSVTPAALETIGRYDWPGNIRELRNVLERSLMLGEGAVVDVPDLKGGPAPTSSSFHLEIGFPPEKGLTEVVSDVSRSLIREALRRTATKQEAAALLGISRHSLAHHMKRLRVSG